MLQRRTLRSPIHFLAFARTQARSIVEKLAKYNKMRRKLEQYRYRAARFQLQLASAAAAGRKTLARKSSVCICYVFMLAFIFYYLLLFYTLYIACPGSVVLRSL